MIFFNTKLVNKEWEDRWLNYLSINEIDWGPIWARLHSNLNSNYVKSAAWEVFHLNFWSNFRAKELCCLCGEVENDITHIINECRILKEIINKYSELFSYIPQKIGILNDNVLLLEQLKVCGWIVVLVTIARAIPIAV